MASGPSFDLPLNLHHAAKIAGRLVFYMERWRTVGMLNDGTNEGHSEAWRLCQRLATVLNPCLDDEDNPVDFKARAYQTEAADLGRQLVVAVEAIGLGDDRFGQALRNLFECLSLGLEGAVLSLRVGEKPDSPLRPI
jgi:hypothetical protein